MRAEAVYVRAVAWLCALAACASIALAPASAKAVPPPAVGVSLGSWFGGADAEAKKKAEGQKDAKKAVGSMDFAAVRKALSDVTGSLSRATGSVCAAVRGAVAWIVTIEVAVWFLMLGIAGGSLRDLAPKIVPMFFWGWAAYHYPSILRYVERGFMAAGLKAGGGGAASTYVADPVSLLELMGSALLPYAYRIATSEWGVSAIAVNLFDALTILSITGMFVYVFGQLAAASVGFHYNGFVGAFAMGFALTGAFRSLAERTVGAVFVHGTKLGVYTGVLALIGPMLTPPTVAAADVTIGAAIVTIVKLFCVGLLVFMADRATADFSRGAASSTAGSVAAAAGGGASFGADAAVAGARGAAAAPGKIAGGAKAAGQRLGDARDIASGSMPGATREEKAKAEQARERRRQARSGGGQGPSYLGAHLAQLAASAPGHDRGPGRGGIGEVDVGGDDDD